MGQCLDWCRSALRGGRARLFTVSTNRARGAPAPRTTASGSSPSLCSELRSSVPSSPLVWQRWRLSCFASAGPSSDLRPSSFYQEVRSPRVRTCFILWVHALMLGRCGSLAGSQACRTHVAVDACFVCASHECAPRDADDARWRQLSRHSSCPILPFAVVRIRGDGQACRQRRRASAQQCAHR